ncbi:MAG: hypothetical protein IJC27_04440, partial [Lentisphaeria bacterium]|nr:hypothetical protein [Lentisphaeria bacterium]
MAVGESKKINGSLTLEDRYQTTIYDDILEIINATITLNDPAGEIFTDKGNDTVTVSNSTITNNSETGAELMFSMGSDNDSLTISNSTLNVNTFMGSGNDTVTVSGTISSTVTINNQFSLGAGDDTLTLKSVLAGPGNLVFGDGNDTLVFDGGHLLTTGSITGLTNLTVTGNTGTLGNNLTLSGSQNAITLNGNLTGTDSYKVITVSDSTVTFKTANNVKTNVVYSVSNVIFNHVDGGTLEIAESSYWAFSADYSTVTLHDTVLRSNGGGFYGTETDWIISNSDISNNTNGVNLTNGSLDLTAVGFSNNNNTALKLSGTALTGKDVSFTSNANGALDILHANAVLDDARFAKNHTNASCISTSRVSASVSAFGGAIRQTAGNMILNNSYFSGNSANVDVIASNSDYAYSFSYASASAYAFATATATVYGGAIANSSGDLIFSGSANYFSDNSANANVIAKAYAIASVSVGPYDNGIASAYAFV